MKICHKSSMALNVTIIHPGSTESFEFQLLIILHNPAYTKSMIYVLAIDYKIIHGEIEALIATKIERIFVSHEQNCLDKSSGLFDALWNTQVQIQERKLYNSQKVRMSF